MRFTVTLTLILIHTLFLQGQENMIIVNGDTVYEQKPSRGDFLLGKGKTKRVLKAYRREYKKSPKETAYNFACAFARNNEPDSAFKYLFYNAEYDTSFGFLCLTDPDFITLRADSRWLKLKDTVLSHFSKWHPGLISNLPLAAKLWDMMAWDQAYYNEVDIARNKLGPASPVVAALWNLKMIIGERNQLELDSIIGIYGWPKISAVGHYASNSAFLIVQHSTLEKQEKYLPDIKLLCEQKECEWQSYALMYDRIKVGQGLPQLYGSQITYNYVTHKYEFFPIEDEINVNKRRAEVGLNPIEDYGKIFGIRYVPKK